MTVRSSIQYNAGFRGARLYELNALGRPKASGITMYNGLAVRGPRTMDLNIAELQQIDHDGGDGVLASQFLPAKTQTKGVIKAAATDYTLLKLLTGVEPGTVGDAVEFAFGTDRQGKSATVGLLTFQQTIGDSDKTSGFHANVFPAIKVEPIPHPYVPGAVEHQFPYLVEPVIQRLWGKPIAIGTDKYSRTPMFDYYSAYQPHIAAFKGDASATEFPFSTEFVPANTTSMSLWDEAGTLVTAGVTLSLTKLTFASAPAGTKEYVIWYECL
jgi:hypothetical protein